MKKMKKVLAVALSLVMAGSLAACGSSSTETKAPETGASETAAESTAESGSEAASEVSTDGKVYNIGNVIFFKCLLYLLEVSNVSVNKNIILFVLNISKVFEITRIR